MAPVSLGLFLQLNKNLVHKAALQMATAKCRTALGLRLMQAKKKKKKEKTEIFKL